MLKIKKFISHLQKNRKSSPGKHLTYINEAFTGNPPPFFKAGTLKHVQGTGFGRLKRFTPKKRMETVRSCLLAKTSRTASRISSSQAQQCSKVWENGRNGFSSKVENQDIDFFQKAMLPKTGVKQHSNRLPSKFRSLHWVILGNVLRPSNFWKSQRFGDLQTCRHLRRLHHWTRNEDVKIHPIHLRSDQ